MFMRNRKAKPIAHPHVFARCVFICVHVRQLVNEVTQIAAHFREVEGVVSGDLLPQEDIELPNGNVTPLRRGEHALTKFNADKQAVEVLSLRLYDCLCWVMHRFAHHLNGAHPVK
jgi:hypothetical protein